MCGSISLSSVPHWPYFLERFDRGLRRPFFVAGGHCRKARGAAHRLRNILTLALEEGGLRIEKIDVRWSATLPEADDALRLRPEVRQTGQAIGARSGCVYGAIS